MYIRRSRSAVMAPSFCTCIIVTEKGFFVCVYICTFKVTLKYSDYGHTKVVYCTTISFESFGELKLKEVIRLRELCSGYMHQSSWNFL